MKALFVIGIIFFSSFLLLVSPSFGQSTLTVGELRKINQKAEQALNKYYFLLKEGVYSNNHNRIRKVLALYRYVMIVQALSDELLERLIEGRRLDVEDTRLADIFFRETRYILEKLSLTNSNFSQKELLELNKKVSELVYQFRSVNLSDVSSVADNTLSFLKKTKKFKKDINRDTEKLINSEEHIITLNNSSQMCTTSYTSCEPEEPVSPIQPSQQPSFRQEVIIIPGIGWLLKKAGEGLIVIGDIVQIGETCVMYIIYYPCKLIGL